MSNLHTADKFEKYQININGAKNFQMIFLIFEKNFKFNQKEKLDISKLDGIAK